MAVSLNLNNSHYTELIEDRQVGRSLTETRVARGRWRLGQRGGWRKPRHSTSGGRSTVHGGPDLSPAPGGRPREELVRRFAAALRGTQLYAPNHPLVARSIDALAEALALVHGTAPSVTIGIVGDDLVVGDIPVPRAAEHMGDLMRRLRDAGLERISIDSGVPPSELETLVQALARGEGTEASRLRLSHVRVGRLEIERQTTAEKDIAGYKTLFADAVSVAARPSGTARTWRVCRTRMPPEASSIRSHKPWPRTARR